MGAEVIRFGVPMGGGGRMLAVVLPGLKVSIEPSGSEHQADAEALAAKVADIGQALDEIKREIEREKDELAAARAKLRSEIESARADVRRLSGSELEPTWFGPAVIRERDGSVWLLAGAEKGWAEFGIRFGSWAELSRERPDVRVCGLAVDATGPYAIARSLGDWPEGRVPQEKAGG